jgi:DnaK suppressor protein
MRRAGNGKTVAYGRRQLEKFRQRLLQRQEELRHILAGRLEDLASAQSEVRGELADAALDYGTQEMSCCMMELAARELGLIERALRKLAQGSYGRCEHCGGQIGLPRLEALPYALYCISCQRELEQDAFAGEQDPVQWDRVYEMERAETDVEVDFSDLETEADR